MARLGAFLLMLAAVVAAPAAAQQWQWFGPYSFFPADSRLTLADGIPSPAARFTTSTAGDLQWIYLGLPLPSGSTIDSVTICYELSNPASFISQVRFNAMAAPSAAPIQLDLGADMVSSVPTCFAQGFSALTTPRQGLLHLGLRLNFASTAHYIEIGAIGVHVTGNLTAIGDDAPVGEIPTSLRLAPNAPNPFNPSTRIAFELAGAAPVELAVYTVDGARVRTLVREMLPAGRHVYDWDGSDDGGRPQASGVYLYQLTLDDRTESRRMTLVR